MKMYILKLFLLNIILLLVIFNYANISFINSDKYIHFYIDDVKYEEKLGTTLKDVLNIDYLYDKGFEISIDMPISNNQKLYSFDLNNKISINSASLDELMKLPGIGEKTANLIIEYRKINGGFKYLEEIKNIKGIKDKKYEKIKEFISL